MSKLNVEFCGINFDNPFLLSSAPPTRNVNQIVRAIKNGWATGVTKTITFEPTLNTRPRIGIIKDGFRPIGMNNIEVITELRIEKWTKELKLIKEAGAPIVASIMAPPEEDKWAKLASIMEESGADMLELNVSCPHGMPESKMGMYIGQNPDLIQKAVKGAKEGCSLPIMVKMTPNVTDIKIPAKAAENAGADALSGINTILSLIGIDINTATPLPSPDGRSTFGGYCGPAVRPIALRMIAEMSKSTNIPVCGMGGINSWENAVEFIMAGASLTQCCTAVMWKGQEIVQKWKEGLLLFMDEQGYDSIMDFKGKALPKIVSFKSLPTNPPLKAKLVKPDKCTRCKKCEIACRDGGYNAITVTNVAHIDREKCDGCGLCSLICPFNCIEIVKY